MQSVVLLVAEVRTRALIQAGEPNFALFGRATQTIQILLKFMMGGELAPKLPEAEPTPLPQHPNSDPIEYWDPQISNDPWEFEIDFWANLAEHPSLQGVDHGIGEQNNELQTIRQLSKFSPNSSKAAAGL